MTRRLQHRDEQGSILLIALVFISLFGIFIAAILAQVSTNMRLTSTTRARTDRLMAADGGLEWAIQHARTQDGACANVGAGQQTLTSALSVDGRAVTVTCKALAGASASPAAQQWSVITNGLTTAAGASPTINGGDVYAGGTISAGSTVATTDADVIRGAADCTAFALTGLTVGAPDISSCSTAGTPDVPHTLPPVPPVRTDPIARDCGGNSWNIWHPGTYKAGYGAEILTYNYLESGVYYFEDIPLNLISSIASFVGGKAPAGESSVLGAECAGIDDATLGAASQATGSGVTIILGGTSTLRAGGNKIELYTRVPATPAGTAGITITTVPSDNLVAGYKPWTAVTAAVNVTGRAAFHGLVYARNAPVSITTNVTAPLLGGVVASTMTITPNSDASKTKAVEANGRRTLLLTSTAAPAASGEIATTQSAVVKVANDPTRTASVRSWRAQ